MMHRHVIQERNQNFLTFSNMLPSNTRHAKGGYRLAWVKEYRLTAHSLLKVGIPHRERLMAAHSWPLLSVTSLWWRWYSYFVPGKVTTQHPLFGRLASERQTYCNSVRTVMLCTPSYLCVLTFQPARRNDLFCRAVRINCHSHSNLVRLPFHPSFFNAKITLGCLIQLRFAVVLQFDRLDGRQLMGSRIDNRQSISDNRLVVRCCCLRKFAIQLPTRRPCECCQDNWQTLTPF